MKDNFFSIPGVVADGTARHFVRVLFDNLQLSQYVYINLRPPGYCFKSILSSTPNWSIGFPSKKKTVL